MEQPTAKSSDQEKSENWDEKVRGQWPGPDREPTLRDVMNLMSFMHDKIVSIDQKQERQDARVNNLEGKTSLRGSRAGSVNDEYMIHPILHQSKEEDEFNPDQLLADLSLIEATRSQKKFIKRANKQAEHDDEDAQDEEDEDHEEDRKPKKNDKKGKKSNSKKDKSSSTVKKALKKVITTPDPSSSDGDDSSDSSSHHSSSSDKKSSKRDSIIRRAVTGTANPTNTVTFTQKMPDHTIKLDSLTVQAIYTFLTGIASYQAAHKVPLPASTLIKDTVRDHLLANSRGKLTEAKFHELKGHELLSILQREIRPTDKLSFYKLMDKNVMFELNINGYRPSTIDFKPLYQAILIFMRKFHTIYELLAEKNHRDNIPPIENKENGLIFLFLNKIPFNYGRNVWATFKEKKFKTIYRFNSAFAKEVQDDYQVYLLARKMQQKFGGSAISSAAFAAARQLVNNNNNERSSRFPSNNRGKSVSRNHRVSAIDEDDFDVEDRIHADNYAESLVRVDAEEEELMDYPPLAKHEKEHEIMEEDSLDERDEDFVAKELQALAAVTTSYSDNKKPSFSHADSKQPKQDTLNGCYGLLLHNECKNKDKCGYSHERAMLCRTHAHLWKLLSESPYRMSANPSAPRTIISNSDRKQSFSNMSVAMADNSHLFALASDDNADVGDDWFHDFSDSHDPQLYELLRTMIFSAVPEASMYSAMHREGEINVTATDRIALAKVLFDTGALHGNYIALRFVEQHKEALKRFLKPYKIIVTLADNKTKLKIDTVAFLPVTFIGDDEVEHRHTVPFCVLETCANDMIIGLPAIARCFSVLMKQMIDQAVVAADMYGNESNVLLSVVAVTEVPAAVQPWTIRKELEAPEDLETELPSSFSHALRYMEMSHEDAVKEFLDLIPTHVDKAFSDATDVIHLLKTKGVNVFVPSNWDGINGIPPLELSWKPNMPTSMKPRPRPVNPKLYEHAKKEFHRLMNYFYRWSTSPIASCLVIAPKATPPFIRFCGDYVDINKWIDIGHYPIPHIQRILEKISKFKVFLDMDMANSFHQIYISAATSSKLSIQTPWGQVEPIFMPEGIGPASGVLQKTVVEIFIDSETEEWMIAIFDNILILAHDYDDAYRKLNIVIDRCIKRNVVLKFSKSWLGFDHAKFFGYICRHGHYELSDDRKNSLKDIPFPKTLKQMQSFLGAALFFKSFVPSYSTLAAPLNDMVRKDFPWSDESAWKLDYRAIYDEFKAQLQLATSIFYPDYSLDWILRTDASLHGVGAVLIQVYRATPESEPVYQPIGFASKKFSPQATRWSTIEQEAYAIYFAVDHFSYYLRCKPFVIETDHNNLLWIEASSVPKVIRWRVFLQSFDFLLRHVAGKINTVADWLSRAYEPLQQAVVLALMISDCWPRFSDELFSMEGDSVQQALDINLRAEDRLNSLLKQVHGGRMGHFGARETWKTLNRHFPGHNVPYRAVAEFVATCAICQKDRLGMTDKLPEIVRHLKPLHQRAVVGADSVKITPADKFGNEYCTTITNHTTKLAALYASKEHNALQTATALFQYACWFGLFDTLITDPGTEFTNEVISHLTKWFGIRHVFSLVDRHESNGVEGTNKITLRLLKALVMDERIVDQWSSPTVLPLIQFMINSHESSETGIVPFHAHFGSADATYFRMPEVKEGDDMLRAHAYIQLLDKNLKLLREISNRFQQKLIEERTQKTPVEKQNKYQPGDLVLWQRNPDNPLPTKLSPKFVGPYEVIQQGKNDVTCKHIILGEVKVFHVTRLKMFFGDIEEAKRVAMIDNDQYVVKKLLAHRGDPLVRTTMEFEVQFADDSVVWLPWSKDLFDTVQYEEYCRTKSELFTLLYDKKTADKMIKDLNSTPITEVSPGDTVYVDLRSYGATWYSSLPLPDIDHITYNLEYKYTRWSDKRKLKIVAECKIFSEKFTVDHLFVKRYGSVKTPTRESVLINNALVKQYPMLLPSATSN